MSSTTYSAVLKTDARLRALVTGSGKALAILGLVVLWTMDFSLFLRSVAAVCWVAVHTLELRRIAAGHKRYRGIRIDEGGGLEVLAGGDEWQPARLRSGCVVLSRFAWLRITLWDDRHSIELLSGNLRENEQWRRFQVIWRHMGGPP